MKMPIGNTKIISEKSFETIHYRRKHFMDKLIIGILEDVGKPTKDLHRYKVYGFPKDNPKTYRLVSCTSDNKIGSKVIDLKPKEILDIMEKKLPDAEFKDWCLSNMGVLDVLNSNINDKETSKKLDGYKKIIERFILNKNVRSIYDNLKHSPLKQHDLLIQESFNILEQKLNEKDSVISEERAEKEQLLSELEDLRRKLHQSQRGDLDCHDKSLLEYSGKGYEHNLL